jgi:hypothetical protein
VANLAALKVVVGADTKPLAAGLKQATDMGNRFSSQFASVGKSLSMQFTAPIIAGAGALGLIAKQTADYADRVDKMSQRLGLGREAFQQWDFVLSQNGVSIDQLQTGMKSLAQRMQEAARGTGEGADMFRRLGVSVTDTGGRMKTQEEAFTDTVRALQQMEGGIEKAALAQKLFGRSGQELLPMLNQSKGSIDELMERARALGLVMGDDAVNAGVQFTDTMDQISRQVKAVTLSFGAKLLPVLQRDFLPLLQEKIVPAMLRTANVIGGLVERWGNLSPVVRLASVGLVGAAAAAGPVLLTLSYMPGVLARVATGFRLVSAAMLGPWGLGIAAVIAGIVAIRSNFLGLGDVARKVWASISDGLGTLVSGMLNILKTGINAQIGVWVGLGRAVKVVWAEMALGSGESTNRMIEALKIGAGALGDFYRWQWEQTVKLYAFMRRLAGDSAADVRAKLEESESLAARVGAAFLSGFDTDYVGAALNGVMGQVSALADGVRDALGGIDGAGAGAGGGLAGMTAALKQQGELASNLAESFRLFGPSGGIMPQALALQERVTAQLARQTDLTSETARMLGRQRDTLREIVALYNKIPDVSLSVPQAPQVGGSVIATGFGLDAAVAVLKAQMLELSDSVKTSGLTKFFRGLKSDLGDNIAEAGKMFKNAGAEILYAFTPAGAAAAFLGGVFDGLRPLLEAMQEPLRVVGELFGKALAPVLEALFPVFKFVAIAATYVGEIFFRVSGAISTAVGGLVRAIGRLVSKLPLIGGALGGAITRAGDAILNYGRAMTAGARALAEGREQLRNMRFGQAADALDRMTASALNVPRGMKALESYMFDAARPSPLPGSSGGTAAGGSTTIVNHWNVPIPTTATNPREAYRMWYQGLQEAKRAAGMMGRDFAIGAPEPV